VLVTYRKLVTALAPYPFVSDIMFLSLEAGTISPPGTLGNHGHWAPFVGAKWVV
jgi:hypothetical protein